MAVVRDTSGAAGLDEALAEIVERTAELVAADVVVARLGDEAGGLTARAVHATSPALRAELEGSRISAGSVPTEERDELLQLPRTVRRVAEQLWRGRGAAAACSRSGRRDRVARADAPSRALRRARARARAHGSRPGRACTTGLRQRRRHEPGRAGPAGARRRRAGGGLRRDAGRRSGCGARVRGDRVQSLPALALRAGRAGACGPRRPRGHGRARGRAGGGTARPGAGRADRGRAARRRRSSRHLAARPTASRRAPAPLRDRARARRSRARPARNLRRPRRACAARERAAPRRSRSSSSARGRC